MLKLATIPVKYSCAVREGLYFPYLTCEVKTSSSDLKVAERQNMHSMSVALRSLVQLAELAGMPEMVHRRILGYSISYSEGYVYIHGHYLLLREGMPTQYARCLLTNCFYIWNKENRWKCYSFVEKLDTDFLPKHVALVKEMLSRIDLPVTGQVTPTGFAESNSEERSMLSPSDRQRSYSEGSSLHKSTTTKQIQQGIMRQLHEKEDESRREDRRQREMGELRQEIRDLRREANEREEANRREKERERETHQREKGELCAVIRSLAH